LWKDAAKPSDRNVIQNETEKKFKYKHSSKDHEIMWNMKCFVLPVIIRATEIVSKEIKVHLEAMPGNQSADILPETAVL
jgi:hypothetical protein